MKINCDNVYDKWKVFSSPDDILPVARWVLKDFWTSLPMVLRAFFPNFEPKENLPWMFHVSGTPPHLIFTHKLTYSHFKTEVMLDLQGRENSGGFLIFSASWKPTLLKWLFSFVTKTMWLDAICFPVSIQSGWDVILKKIEQKQLRILSETISVIVTYCWTFLPRWLEHCPLSSHQRKPQKMAIKGHLYFWVSGFA